MLPFRCSFCNSVVGSSFIKQSPEVAGLVGEKFHLPQLQFYPESFTGVYKKQSMQY